MLQFSQSKFADTFSTSISIRSYFLSALYTCVEWICYEAYDANREFIHLMHGAIRICDENENCTQYALQFAASAFSSALTVLCLRAPIWECTHSLQLTRMRSLKCWIIFYDQLTPFCLARNFGKILNVFKNRIYVVWHCCNMNDVCDWWLVRWYSPF